MAVAARARRRPGRRAAALCAAAWMAVAAPAARAQPGTASAAPARGDERVGYVARQLERSPVYVSDTLQRVVTAGDIRRLLAEVRRQPSPAYVAIVPSFFDESLREDELAGLLRARLRRAGVYLTLNEFGSDLGVVTLGGATTSMSPAKLAIAMYEDLPRRAGPAESMLYVLELLRTGRRSPRGGGDDVVAGARPEDAGIVAVALLVFGGLTVPFARARLRSRRRAAPRPAPAALAPAAGHEAAAVAALTELAGAIERAADPPRPRWTRTPPRPRRSTARTRRSTTSARSPSPAAASLPCTARRCGPASSTRCTRVAASPPAGACTTRTS
jgi:hypothetical protein